MIGKFWPMRLALLLLAISAAMAAAAHGDGSNPADAVDHLLHPPAEGTARLGALRSRVMETSMRAGWLKATVKTSLLWPDRVLMEAKLPLFGKDISSGYDGVIGWTAGDDGAPQRLMGRELQEFVLHQRLDRMARLFDLYPVRRLLPQSPGAALPLQQVEMDTAFGAEELWSFDPATGLLQSTDGLHDEGPKKGMVRVVARLEDYRTVDGLNLPFRALIQDGKSAFTITITKLDDNAAVDATAIAAPAVLRTP